MKKSFKCVMSLLLAVALLFGLLPTQAYAAGKKGNSSGKEAVHLYTEEENALLENDVFAKINELEANTAQTMGGQANLAESDYIAMIPDVIAAIKSSETYVAGSLQQNGSFLVWQTTTGIPCCYDPRMEAKLHSAPAALTQAELTRMEDDLQAFNRSLEGNLAELNGGSPSSVEIGLIQPYWESSSSYADSSFTSYSPYYKSMWQSLYQATGGSSGYRYSMTNATVDNVAKAIANCGIVIMDSHGTTDYSGSNGDYTSRANCSYLCLTSNSGITSTDTAAKTGPYGTYYECLKGSGYAYVSGTCIANHMTKNAPHSLVYMGICLGMATDGMYKGLRNKGVEAVYGYSQSVSFKGERIYMQAIMGYLKDGDNLATAISKTKSSYGSWDPAYSSYSLSQAKSNKVAFPIVVSSEDSYPGHGNVDAVQTVYSTWQLFGAQTSYTVTATSNNTNYGTVSVSGNTITASPKTGYYASGYKVTSGSAAVAQDGNTFTVTPASDCTVQIVFAAKQQYTVTLKANGANYSTLKAYAGDAVTLPSNATAVDGWNFAGWSANTVNETTTKPSYMAPGASYTPTGNVTLYALYTRNEGGSGGETVYELLTSAPSNWAGSYVITYGKSASGMYVMKGLSGNTKYESASAGGAVALSSTGMTLSDNKLYNAGNAYVFNVAAYNSKYSIKNASTGTYLASKSSYLYSNTSLSSSYCAWSLAMSSGAVSASNSASSSYPYLAFSSNKYFMINRSASSIYFWKQGTAGVSYYATSPSAVTEEPHEHSYGAWTSNNNGTHSRVCECGESETANCTYTAVVTAPTATAQGYTTYTCSVCGYSYVGDYTPATGYTYTVNFSVPSGVTAPASMTCNSNSSITLPSAGALSGYTFLGWVTSALNNSASRPSSILSGTYKPTGNITLYALYSYTTSSGGTGYQLMTSAPSDWSGKYVITYGNSDSMYVLKGLSGNTKYESVSAGGAVALGNTGMTLSGSTLTNVADAYVFTAAAYNSKYTLKNVSTGTYLASRSNYLYSYRSLSSSYCAWTLSMSGSSVVASNSNSRNYPYLAFSSSGYFMINRSASSGIYFWKLTNSGSATYYTTICN